MKKFLLATAAAAALFSAAPASAQTFSALTDKLSYFPGITTSIDGGGVPGLLPGNSRWSIIQRPTATTAQGYALYLERNPSYTGNGGQTGALQTQCTTPSGVSDQLGWCNLFATDNYNTSSTANASAAAIYARKESGATSTWGATIGIAEFNANSSYGAVTTELDMTGVGTDSGNHRVGIDLVAGCWDPIPSATCTAGGKPEFGYALRIGPFNGLSANAKIKTAIKLYGDITTAVDAPGFNVDGTDYGTVSIGWTHYGNPGTADGEKIRLYGTPGTYSANDYSIGVGAGTLWLNTGANLDFDISGSFIAGVTGAGLNIAKRGASSAPGAGRGSIIFVAGTNAGTCKMQVLAGTSTTPTTVVDNVGSGC